MTRLVHFGKFCKQYLAILACWAYSAHKIWQSPLIGQENKNKASRDLLARLGRVVYDTAHIIILKLKCRPRRHKWDKESSSFPDRTISSTKIQIFLVIPLDFSCSCCSSNLSISFWFHELKINLESNSLSNKAFISGLHATVPIKEIIKSNCFDIRCRRWWLRVDFPCRLPPRRPITNGIFSAI